MGARVLTRRKHRWRWGRYSFSLLLAILRGDLLLVLLGRLLFLMNLLGVVGVLGLDLEGLFQGDFYDLFPFLFRVITIIIFFFLFKSLFAGFFVQQNSIKHR